MHMESDWALCFYEAMKQNVKKAILVNIIDISLSPKWLQKQKESFLSTKDLSYSWPHLQTLQNIATSLAMAGPLKCSIIFDKAVYYFCGKETQSSKMTSSG